MSNNILETTRRIDALNSQAVATSSDVGPWGTLDTSMTNKSEYDCNMFVSAMIASAWTRPSVTTKVQNTSIIKHRNKHNVSRGIDEWPSKSDVYNETHLKWDRFIPQPMSNKLEDCQNVLPKKYIKPEQTNKYLKQLHTGVQDVSSVDGFYNDTAINPPLPGEFPSCMIFDQDYPYTHSTVLHDNQSKASLKEKSSHTLSNLSEAKNKSQNSWGVIALAYPEGGSDKVNSHSEPTNEENSNLLKLTHTTLRQRKAFKELPLPERAMDFVESCALNVSTITPTIEEYQQNVAAMDIFFPGWSEIITKVSPPHYLKASPLRFREMFPPSSLVLLEGRSQEYHDNHIFPKLNISSQLRSELINAGEQAYDAHGLLSESVLHSVPFSRYKFKHLNQMNSFSTVNSSIRNLINMSDTPLREGKHPILGQKLQTILERPNESTLYYPYPHLSHLKRDIHQLNYLKPLLNEEEFDVYQDTDLANTSHSHKPFQFYHTPYHGSEFIDFKQQDSLTVSDIKDMTFLKGSTNAKRVSSIQDNTDWKRLIQYEQDLTLKLNQHLDNQHTIGNVITGGRLNRKGDPFRSKSRDVTQSLDIALHTQHLYPLPSAKNDNLIIENNYLKRLHFPLYSQLKDPTLYQHPYTCSLQDSSVTQPDNFIKASSPLVNHLNSPMIPKLNSSYSVTNDSTLRTRRDPLDKTLWLLEFDSIVPKSARYNHEYDLNEDNDDDNSDIFSDISDITQQFSRSLSTRSETGSVTSMAFKKDIEPLRLLRRRSSISGVSSILRTMRSVKLTDQYDIARYDPFEMNSEGCYWEDSIPDQQRHDILVEKAASAIPIEVVRARRLKASEQKRDQQAQHKELLIKQKQELRNASHLLKQVETDERRLLLNHRHETKNLKRAIDQRRLLKVEKLKKILNTEDKDKRIDSSDEDYWNSDINSVDTVESDMSLSDSDDSNASIQSTGPQTLEQKKIFIDTIDRSVIHTLLQEQQQQQQQQRLVTIQTELLCVPKRYQPRYVIRNPTTKEVLNWPVSHSGWLRQNQTDSPSGIMFFELRGNVLLFYVPKKQFVLSIKERSSMGFKQFQIPLPDSHFPPLPTENDIELLNGVLLNQYCQIQVLHDDSDAENIPLSLHTSLKTSQYSSVQTSQHSFSSRRKSSFNQLFSVIIPTKTTTFPPGKWRIKSRIYLSITGSLLFPFSTKKSKQYSRLNTGSSLSNDSLEVRTCTLCIQGLSDSVTDKWKKCFDAIQLVEYYISICFQLPDTYPNRLVIESLRDLVNAISDDTTYPSTYVSTIHLLFLKELVFDYYHWDERIMSPLFKRLSTFSNINSLSFKGGALPLHELQNGSFSIYFQRDLTQASHHQSLLPASNTDTVQCMHFKSINVSCNPLTTSHLHYLSSFILHSNCRYLMLDSCQLNDDALPFIGQMITTTHLKTMVYCNNQLHLISKLTQHLKASHSQPDFEYFVCNPSRQLINQPSDFVSFIERLEHVSPSFIAMLITDTTDITNCMTSLLHSKCILVPPHQQISIFDVPYITSVINPYCSELDLTNCIFHSNDDLTNIIKELRQYQQFYRLRLTNCTGTLSLSPKLLAQPYTRPNYSFPISSSSSINHKSVHTELYPYIRELSMDGCTFLFSNTQQLLYFTDFICGSQTKCPTIRQASPSIVANLLRLIIWKTSVEVLEVSGCNLSDAVMEQLLSDLKKQEAYQPINQHIYSKLEVLNLSHNQLTFKGVSLLINIVFKRLEYMSHIDCSMNPIQMESRIVYQQLQQQYPLFTMSVLELTSKDVLYSSLFQELCVTEMLNPEIVEESAIDKEIELRWEKELQRLKEILRLKRQQKEDAHRVKNDLRRQKQLESKKRREQLLHTINKLGGYTSLHPDRMKMKRRRLSRLEYRNDLVQSAINDDEMKSYVEESQETCISPRIGVLELSERDFKLSSVTTTIIQLCQTTHYIDGMDLRNSEFCRLSELIIDCGLHFKTLDLSFNNLTHGILNDLLQMLNVTNTSKLILDGNPLLDHADSAKLLDKLSLNCHELRILSMRGTSLSHQFGLALEMILKNRRQLVLRESSLKSTAIYDDIKKDQTSGLLRLRLQHNLFSIETLKVILRYADVTYPKIIKLDLGGTHPDLSPAFIQTILKDDPSIMLSKQLLTAIQYSKVFVVRTKRAEIANHGYKQHSKYHPATKKKGIMTKRTIS